jgi:hypothetical protein
MGPPRRQWHGTGSRGGQRRRRDDRRAAGPWSRGSWLVVMPGFWRGDNMGAIVDDADALEPRLNQAFVEYAQARGFHVDPTRVRHRKDKPKVERAVPFARWSFFAGERLIDLADAQRRAEEWCRVRAGLRVHGTTQARPRCSPQRSSHGCCRPRRSLMTCRSTRRPRCTGTTTGRWPRPCTRCPQLKSGWSHPTGGRH